MFSVDQPFSLSWVVASKVARYFKCESEITLNVQKVHSFLMFSYLADMNGRSEKRFDLREMKMDTALLSPNCSTHPSSNPNLTRPSFRFVISSNIFCDAYMYTVFTRKSAVALFYFGGFQMRRLIGGGAL